MSIYLPLLIALIGFVIYFATNNKASAIGLHCFWVGLLAYLLRSPGPSIQVFK